MFVYTVRLTWPEEGTKVLVAAPYENGDQVGIVCREGTVREAGPIMRIEFFVPSWNINDSVFRTNDRRGVDWCVDDQGEEAAAFRATTVMA